jgi:hypothetical protein
MPQELQKSRPCAGNTSLNRLAEEGSPLTPDECRALQRLNDVPRGIAKTLMLAHGFTHELIEGLVLNGLATVAPDMARIGKQTIEIELVMITDAGRKAILIGCRLAGASRLIEVTAVPST